MALIDKETVRAEIERRHAYQKEMYNKTKPDGRPNDGWAESLAIMGELEELTNYLDTLPEQLVGDHHEIEVEFRGEKVTINREFYRDGEMNYSTSEQDDNAIWAALRAWCEKKGITPFELYPKQPEQPASDGLEEEIARYLREDCSADDEPSISDIARHFYELGKKSLK